MSFPIVAIGASAGGLDAVSELLDALPQRSGMAYIFVQHLAPGHASVLPEILSKRTDMPVLSAHDGQRIDVDHVYVIPPNTTLSLTDGHLRLDPREGGAPHKPVDILFTSLAREHAQSAIAVVLSGGDADGTLGVQEVKHGGGITFAQDPESARFPSMPQNAISTGCVDFVLPPKRIAQELTRLGGHPYLARATNGDGAKRVTDEPPGEESVLRSIFRRLRASHGVDFTHYKRSTLGRRLARRMALQKIDELPDYLALLEADPIETAALYQDFLIRVTGFFRDAESFDALRHSVFPILTEGRAPNEPIRIWVPGCASGEEVYSIAICLMEYLGDRQLPGGVQIFGTDVSEAAIETARAGVYAAGVELEVSAERMERFFVKQEHGYRIAQSIRDLCIFARQDVTRDPPFSRLDLVSCRNLLIYLDAAAQARVMQVFHYSLRPHGFLLLGPSESVGHAADLFELADKPHRLFTRRTGAPGATLAAPRGSAPHRGSRDSEIGDRMLGDADSPLREADRILLARYAPASLLVDDQLNVLQFRGETGPYLEPASGPPSTALHRIVRPELLAEVAPAIQEARETGNEVRREGLRLEDAREVAIQVIALQSLNSERGFLILFDDGSRRRNDRRARQSPAKVLTESEKDRRLAQLEREAVAIRDYLQATMEAHEAVKEELKSAHEEVLSANEEFQSTNEELETSKEELQSTNEELVTTNEELRNRNRELAALNEELRGARARSEMARHYAEAIVETVREPLVVLDTDLKILRANRAFYAEFDVSRDETENRFLYEVGNGQWNVPALRERLHSVITDRVPLANFDVTAVFPSIGRRLMSLNARRVAGDGERSDVILLAIDDITEQKAANDHLREINRRKDEFLAMLAHELRNPLAPISYAMQLLRRSEVEPAVARMYDMIERQTGRLKRLVDELLDVARISRGVIELKRQVVDLIDIAQAAGEACRPRLLERRHQLKLVLPDAPVLVDGDPVRLEQVVSNLLENAIKYTNPGGQIVLALAQQGRSACIRVRDNGIGLAPEMLDHVFDLFTQVDTSLSHAGGGLGLGLTVVRRVLELHGGGIEARSDGLGKGSEFIVTVPVITDAALLESATRRPPQRVDGGRRRRVLIVDDNEDAAESMALLAGAWGHQVAVAHDGPAALELAKTFHPQIAIVDIGLPGMDGYEVARRLRKENDPSALRLMAMTGYGRTQDREAAIAAGFAFHLVKPADVDQLQELLAQD